MKLKFPIKHDGERFPAGEYTGGLPKDIEAHFIKEGYFDTSAGDEPEQSVDGLTLEEMSELSVAKLKSVCDDLNDEEIMSLLELEEAKGDKQRSSIVKHLTGLLD